MEEILDLMMEIGWRKIWPPNQLRFTFNILNPIENLLCLSQIQEQIVSEISRKIFEK